MANRHIKTINGRKYYYSSIRIGKKVTSRYLGPVEDKKKKKEDAQATMQIDQPAAGAQQEEDYIG